MNAAVHEGMKPSRSRAARPRFAVFAAAWLAACCSSPVQEPPTPSTPLYTNLGDHRHPISTRSPDAQAYFDQGLTLLYAFNHAEAVRAFRQAAALDPACAMCYWGVALALGPNINMRMTDAAGRDARQAIVQARQRAGRVTDREREYIEALTIRFPDANAFDQESRDRQYASAMDRLAARFPDDPDAATLYAQALMEVSPWVYWAPDGRPGPLTTEVLRTLESVLDRHPDHVGAIHLYIHAVQISDNPGRATRYAERLATLAPGAGHLVHMPAHVQMRVGRYAEATALGDRAVEADEAYLAGDHAERSVYAQAYYPRHIQFIAVSAAMEGRRGRALEAAAAARDKAPSWMWRDARLGGLMQHLALTPVYTMVRFGMWESILAESMPAGDLPFMRAILHMARGLAYAFTERLDEAQDEADALAPLRSLPSLSGVHVSRVSTAADLVAIAHEILLGELAAQHERVGVAARHLAQAVALETALIYGAPPDWPLPTRQLQGAALLALGRAEEAEIAFRADLQRFPDNGWSLSGLGESLEQQGKAAEAEEMSARLARAWAGADTVVEGGRVLPTGP